LDRQEKSKKNSEIAVHIVVDSEHTHVNNRWEVSGSPHLGWDSDGKKSINAAGHVSQQPSMTFDGISCHSEPWDNFPHVHINNRDWSGQNFPSQNRKIV
jgi:hypothetical protein